MSTPRFCKFDCSIDVAFIATHCLPHAHRPAGREPHEHTFKVKVGWSHECSFGSGGFTWDADEVRAKVADATLIYHGADLNKLFTHPTIEVLAADLLDRLPSYFDWVEVSHRDDYRARITRRHLSQEWLENYRVKRSSESCTPKQYAQLLKCGQCDP